MKQKKEPRYHYDKVICERVIDGDTIDVIIDLGFGIKKKERLRLYGIDAWEVRGAERRRGLESKEYVEEKLFSGGYANDVRGTKIKQFPITFSIETYKKGKYGRYLAKIFIAGKCLNDELVEKSHAVYKDY